MLVDTDTHPVTADGPADFSAERVAARPPSDPARPAPDASSSPLRARSRKPAAYMMLVLLPVLAAIAGWWWLEDAPLRAMRHAERAQDWPRAVSLALAYLRTAPEDAEALRVAARGLSHQRQYDQAESFFERAGDLPLADLHLRAKGLVLMDRTLSAIALFEQILQIDPGDVESARRLALMYHSLGRIDEAVELVRRAGQDPNQTARMLALEAIFRDDQGRVQDSIDCLLRAIELNPDTASVGDMPAERAYTLLGRNLLRLGRSEEARVWLRRSVRVAETPIACWLLAESEHCCGEPAQAKIWWRRALELDPKHGPTLNSLGQLALRDGEPLAAVNWLTLALQCGENTVAVHSGLARAYARTGQPDRMQEHQQKAESLREELEQSRMQDLVLRQQPDSIDGLRVLVDRALKEGKIGQAREIVDELSERFPEHQQVQQMRESLRLGQSP